MQEFWPRISHQTRHFVSTFLRDLRKKPRSFHGRARHTRVEKLEGRTLLTALVPPTVSTTSFAGTGTVSQNATSLTVTFSETVNGANVSGNYALQRAGTDGILGTADDISVAITSATFSGNVATLNFAALATPDLYRLTVKDGIQDTFSHYLDGDSNGIIGGNNVRNFTVGTANVVYEWGKSVTTPVNTLGVTDFVSLSQGVDHTVGLKADGTVWAWGSNGYGQLGDGTTVDRSTPVQVVGLSGVTAISAGSVYSLALDSFGNVRCWGYNLDGRLGDGTLVNRLVPSTVAGASGITQISAGGSHGLALRNDGSVYAWGNNGVGAVGDGTMTSRTTAVLVPSLSGVTKVAAGFDFSLALLANGTVNSWGFNAHGELGDGTTVNRLVKTPVSGLTNVTDISLKTYHSLALLADGTVRAWGYNAYGDLGDGTTVNRSTPVVVSGLSNIAQIAAGDDHNLVKRGDGAILSWGYNNVGQLGDGTTTNRLTPIVITSLNGLTVEHMSAGPNKSAILASPVVQALPKIEFSAPSASGAEGSIALAPRLLVNGTVVGGQSVDVTVTGGSATLGTDFFLTTTITIPAGTYDGTAGTSIDIPLALLSDFDSESTEDIQFTLLHPTTGVALGDANGNSTSQATHVYQIANLVDITPPTVTTTSFAGTGTVAVNATSLTVSFSETVTGANVPGSYALQRAGTDFVLGTADDVTVPITSATVSIGTATLNFAALPTDLYRLIVLIFTHIFSERRGNL